MDVAVRSSRSLITIQGKVLLLPVHLCKLWLLGSLNLVLSIFHLLGFMPNEYANRVKIAELNRHIDDMHQREDEYRRRLEALSEQLELHNRDKSKAIKKLQRARANAYTLSQSLDGMQAGAGSGRGGGGDTSFGHNATLTHTLLWGAVLSAYLSSRSLSSLEMKLLMTVMIPVVLMYLMMQSAQKRSWRSVTIQCISAGVLGFSVNHLVC